MNFAEYYLIKEKETKIFDFFYENNGTISNDFYEVLVEKFGEDKVLKEVWDTLKKYGSAALQGAKQLGSNALQGAKQLGSNALQGAKQFGSGLASGFQQGYIDSRSVKNAEEIEKFIGDKFNAIGHFSKVFGEKFKISPLTAAILMSSAMTGGLGGVSMIALTMVLRKKITWLADKSFDGAIQKITGKTPQELDQAWRNRGQQQPVENEPKLKNPTQKVTNSPKKPENVTDAMRKIDPYYKKYGESSFNNYLLNRDEELFLEISGLSKKIGDTLSSFGKNVSEKGLAGASGEILGKAAGVISGSTVNVFQGLGRVIKKSLSALYNFISQNPVSSSKAILAVIAGYYIGNGMSSKLNSLIHGHAPQTDIEQMGKALKDSGVDPKTVAEVKSELADSSLEDINMKKSFLPEKGTQTYYANADTGGKMMPTVGSPEDIALKKSFLPDSTKSWSPDLGDYKEKISSTGEKLFQSEDGNLYKALPNKIDPETILYQKVDAATGKAIGAPGDTDYMVNTASSKASAADTMTAREKINHPELFANRAEYKKAISDMVKSGKLSPDQAFKLRFK